MILDLIYSTDIEKYAKTAKIQGIHALLRERNLYKKRVTPSGKRVH